MEDKKKPTFPKGFFTKPRPTTSSKEALKDVIPIDWEKPKEKKVSFKEKKVL